MDHEPVLYFTAQKFLLKHPWQPLPENILGFLQRLTTPKVLMIWGNSATCSGVLAAAAKQLRGGYRCLMIIWYGNGFAYRPGYIWIWNGYECTWIEMHACGHAHRYAWYEKSDEEAKLFEPRIRTYLSRFAHSHSSGGCGACQKECLRHVIMGLAWTMWTNYQKKTRHPITSPHVVTS